MNEPSSNTGRPATEPLRLSYEAVVYRYGVGSDSTSREVTYTDQVLNGRYALSRLALTLQDAQDDITAAATDWPNQQEASRLLRRRDMRNREIRLLAASEINPFGHRADDLIVLQDQATVLDRSRAIAQMAIGMDVRPNPPFSRILARVLTRDYAARLEKTYGRQVAPAFGKQLGSIAADLLKAVKHKQRGVVLPAEQQMRQMQLTERSLAALALSEPNPADVCHLAENKDYDRLYTMMAVLRSARDIARSMHTLKRNTR